LIHTTINDSPVATLDDFQLEAGDGQHSPRTGQVPALDLPCSTSMISRVGAGLAVFKLEQGRSKAGGPALFNFLMSNGLGSNRVDGGGNREELSGDYNQANRKGVEAKVISRPTLFTRPLLPTSPYVWQTLTSPMTVLASGAMAETT
jgi:hypothetical protein